MAMIVLVIASCSTEEKTDATKGEKNNGGEQTSYKSVDDPVRLHNLSVHYRELSELCGTADSNKANFLELTFDQTKDMLGAMRAINENAESAGLAAPAAFRLIYGQDEDNPSPTKVKLIVVGVNNASGQGEEASYISYSKVIDGYLPCPRHCDVNVSEIAMGQNGPCVHDEHEELK